METRKRASSSKTPERAVSYVRVKLVMNWVSGDGKTISGEPVNIDAHTTRPSGSSRTASTTTPSRSDRRRKAEQCHDQPAATPITQDAAPEGYHLEVTVLAESIQAAPSAAVQQSWGVGVDSNGYLTQPTTTP